MFFRLTSQVKRRLIEEMRRYWGYHPKYPNLPEHIQGKYSFKERPQEGIIVKSGSASLVTLSADNYLGVSYEHCVLTRVPDYPGLAAEWVREDATAIAANGGSFPSAPGVYYVEVQARAADPAYNASPQYEFYVDPLLEVINRIPTTTDGFTYTVGQPFLEGTLAVYEMPGEIQLMPDVQYTADPETGLITLVNVLERGQYLSVDFKYAAETTGPWPIVENFSNNTAIPGVVLCFGRRLAADRFAVVVSAKRQPVALEYGGRSDVEIDIELFARDPEAQMEITDQTQIYLWAILRSRLASEGMEITQVSASGESEEIYDDVGDDYFYNASLNVSVQTDWFVYVPLGYYIRAISQQNATQRELMASLSAEGLRDVAPEALQNIRAVSDLGLALFTDPYGPTFPGLK